MILLTNICKFMPRETCSSSSILTIFYFLLYIQQHTQTLNKYYKETVNVDPKDAKVLLCSKTSQAEELTHVHIVVERVSTFAACTSL